MTGTTWDFVENNFFPNVVEAARKAGFDTNGWAIDRREGPGRIFCRLQENGAVATVYHRFSRPGDADQFFQGMAWTLARLPRIPIETTGGPTDDATDGSGS